VKRHFAISTKKLAYTTIFPRLLLPHCAITPLSISAHETALNYDKDTSTCRLTKR